MLEPSTVAYFLASVFHPFIEVVEYSEVTEGAACYIAVGVLHQLPIGIKEWHGFYAT